MIGMVARASPIFTSVGRTGVAGIDSGTHSSAIDEKVAGSVTRTVELELGHGDKAAPLLGAGAAFFDGNP